MRANVRYEVMELAQERIRTGFELGSLFWKYAQDCDEPWVTFFNVRKEVLGLLASPCNHNIAREYSSVREMTHDARGDNPDDERGSTGADGKRGDPKPRKGRRDL